MIVAIRRTVLVTALLLPAACAKKAGGSGSDSAKADSATTAAAGSGSLTLPVSASRVRNGDLVLTVVTKGEVRSGADAKLRSEAAGTIEAVLVRPGDRVGAGQALVRFDPRPFDISVQQAEAAVAEAEVRFRDAIVPDSLATGRAPTEEQRRGAIAKSGLLSARAGLEKAKYERERATVVSPFAGMIDRIDVARGERVGAGENLLTVVSLGELRVEASVLEHDMPLIKVGGEAIVTSAADPGRQAIGRVAAVLPVIDSATRAGKVYVRIPANAALRPGMYADVRLEAQRLSNRRLVPARAVIERDGRPLVFVVKDGRAQWVYIQAGRSNGRETEVLPDSGSGQIPVNPGDEVIIEGHLTLTHDAPVRIVGGDTAQVKPPAVRKR